jgi:hypothetical protein
MLKKPNCKVKTILANPTQQMCKHSYYSSITHMLKCCQVWMTYTKKSDNINIGYGRGKGLGLGLDF